MQETYHGALRHLNLKVTPKRLAILDIMAKEPVYFSPDEIWERMKERFRHIGLPTVYRNLEELSEGSVIAKVIHPNRQLYYYFCPNQDQHHHHFICISCRRVQDVHVCGVREIEEEVKKKIRGRVLSHILQVNGLCKKCSRK